MRDTNNLLTVNEVARLLNVSKMTIYRLIHSEQIPSVLIGKRTFRVPERGLKDYLEQNTSGR